MVIRDLVDCEHERRLKRPPAGHPAISDDAIRRDLEASAHDLESARGEFERGDHKWAIVKAYYSMLHAASALARARGYVIENHFCMFLFLRKLVDRGELESVDAYSYRTMTESRAKADYGLSYSEEAAIEGIRFADQFQARVRSLIPPTP